MDKEIKNELHQEFQVERMILFSDAVFAIVITLMAIEMQLPEIEGHYTAELFERAIVHLIPVIIAYIATFGFIGLIWYQHLRLFSLVKAFNRGLVIRNLVLLFCVGFFPFSASILGKVNTAETMAPMLFYLAIILCCMTAQVNLQWYILFKKPELRNSINIAPYLVEYRKKKAGVFAFLLVLLTYIILSFLLQDSVYFYFAPMSFALTPLFMKIMGAYKKDPVLAEE